MKQLMVVITEKESGRLVTSFPAVDGAGFSINGLPGAINYNPTGERENPSCYKIHLRFMEMEPEDTP